jgi:class 3 adenylate cyclase
MAAAAGRAGQGRGGVVLVSGEAGIGKTTVVNEFLARQRGAVVLWGACEDLTTPRTFGPLHDMARSDPGLLGALDDGSHLDIYEALLAALSPPTGLAVAVIEDAHWADQATIDAMRYVGRRAAQGHGMLVVTARTEALVGDHPLRLAFGGIPPGSVVRIELPALSRDGVVALAGSHPVDEVLAITGGNPFFVTELLDSGLDLPRSVIDSILARAAGLSPSVRDALAVIAVVPGETEQGLIDALGLDLPAALAEAEPAGLILTTATAVRFRHELARRAYEASLSADRRRAENQRVFSHLEETGADPARLVHHAEQAESFDGVARWAPVAGREAATVGAHRQAVEHLERAILLLDRYPPEEQASLLELLAWERYVLGRFSDARDPAEHAVTVREGLGEPVATGNALRLLSRIHWIRGERRAAEQRAEEAIAALEPLGESPDLALAYSTRSQLAMLKAEDGEAIRWGTVAVDMARRVGDPQALSHALNNVGTAQAHQTDSVEGVELIVQARRLAIDNGLDEDAVRAWTNEAWSLLWSQRYQETGPLLEEAIGFARDRQQDGFEAYLTATRAMHRLSIGDWDGAEADVRWVLQQPAVAGTTDFPAASTWGSLLARRGEFAEARTVLEAGWEHAVVTDELQRTFPMAIAIAELGWLEGRPQDGMYALNHIDDDVAHRGTSWERAEVAMLRRRAGFETSAPSDAPEPYRLWFGGDYRAAADAWRRIGDPYASAWALADSGEIQDLEEALEAMDRLGAVAAAGRIAFELEEARGRRRRLATVLFTDVVGSTEMAGRLGDDSWRTVLDRHDATTARVVARHGGRVITGTGDGVMASFDTPSSAIAAAVELVEELSAAGVTIRAGLHTGEVVPRGDSLGGMAVHIAARVGAEAGAGQVLVSSTTRDLVVGGGRSLTDVGTRRLKGVADEWRLYEVAG